MRHVIAQMVLAIHRRFLRRAMSVAVALSLVFGMFAAGIPSHHEEDADAAVAISDGVTSASGIKGQSGHLPSLLVADHDCHNCASANVSAVADLGGTVIPSRPEMSIPGQMHGRVTGTELRPPIA